MNLGVEEHVGIYRAATVQHMLGRVLQQLLRPFRKEPRMSTFDESELRERLTPEQYEVTQKAGTERAFTGEYHDTKSSGTYHCRVCDEPLFSSETKYDSGSGWPSFTLPMADGAVGEKRDITLGMVRTESLCTKCGAHLGHVFPDGPGDGGLRYCMNSASLRLEADEHGSETVAQ
jgi:peptide-methionine (R)-S-oxide reductase